MTIEARRAIRIPVSDAQHVTFMLADLMIDKENNIGEEMITVIYEDAAGEAVVNIIPVKDAEEKLQTIYPEQKFATILALLQKNRPAPVRKIITDLN